MSDHAALTRLALEAGLPEAEVRDTLATDRYAAEVREDEATARGLGISAVPFFVVDRRYGIAGAHPAPVLLQAIEQAWAERQPA
jgi:predicted DsbA family dithiol-disulfide isomerase